MARNRIAYQRMWRAKNRDRIREARRGDGNRDYHLRHKYGI